MSTNNSNRERLRSGELAELACVSTDTLRHYERKGVLRAPERLQNNYRSYPREALDRVLLVRRALAVGFTLDELSSILKARDKGVAPCRQVHALAAEKLAEVEERIKELRRLRDDLRLTLKEWDARLSKTGHGERAGLLESLAAGDVAQPVTVSKSSPLKFRTNKTKRRLQNEK